jgi:hypothetical protein
MTRPRPTLTGDAAMTPPVGDIGVHLGRGLVGQPEAWKKSTAQARHSPIYRAEFGPRSRPMGGHGHGPFKAGTKWPI